jgi:hypothetical protein
MQSAELTQAIKYRIDGIDEPGEAPAEYARWHYIGVLDGVARFNDGQGTARMLDVDRLVVVEHGRLRYKPE